MGDGRVDILAGPPPGGPQAARPQELHLTPFRAAFWPARRTLIIADLHLGKADTLAASGAVGWQGEVSRRVLREDLARLARATAATRAERVLIVGDLLHAHTGLTDDLLAEVAAFKAEHPAPWVLIRGNHDAKINRAADAWKLTVHAERLEEGGLTFEHIPPDPPPPDAFTISGHEHPAVTLAGRGGLGIAKLPAFIVGPTRLILPAFSRFTSGGRARLSPGDRVYACGPRDVFEVP